MACASSVDDQANRHTGRHSTAYTRQEIGPEANKPSASVPEEITGALANALAQPGW